MINNINILVRGSRGRIGTAICSQIESDMSSFTRIIPTNAYGSLTLYLQNLSFPTLIILASGNSDNSSNKSACKIDTENIVQFLEYISKANLAKANDHILFISSGGTVYGDSLQQVTESTGLNPKTPYAEEKVLQEILIRDWADRRGIRSYIFRLANVYAVNSLRPKGLIERAVHSLSAGVSMSITSSYNSRKQYGTSYDYAKWILSSWREIQLFPDVSILNLFAKHSYSINEVLVKVGENLSQNFSRFNQISDESKMKSETVILDTNYKLAFLNGGWVPLEVALTKSEGKCLCLECL